MLPVRNIERIEAADNYVRIWIGSRSYLLREALQQMERRVRAHGFMRVHRWTPGRVAYLASIFIEA